MKKLSWLLIIFFITSCIAPSAEIIQTAIAKTQIAQPTNTKQPTPIKSPATTFTEEYSIPEEFQGKLSLFILAGQSNMSGFGELPKSIQDTNPRILLFGNDYHWKIAVEPIDDSKNQVDIVSYDFLVGFSPALAFATTLLEHYPDMVIGLIPCAKDKSSIYQWQRNLSDESLYGSCLKRIKAASTMGKVAGILFFQGESDALDPNFPPKQIRLPNEWASRFMDFVNSWRSDLGLPKLPVIFAQIGQNTAPDRFYYWEIVKQQQEAVKMSFCKMIKTDDLDLADDIHFTTESYKVIGTRFANAYMGLIQINQP